MLFPDKWVILRFYQASEIVTRKIFSGFKATDDSPEMWRLSSSIRLEQEEPDRLLVYTESGTEYALLYDRWGQTDLQSEVMQEIEELATQLKEDYPGITLTVEPAIVSPQIH